MSWIRGDDNGVVSIARLVPRAAKNQIVGITDGELKIRIKGLPVEGKANKALVQFLAEVLGVRLGCIALIGGETGRHKRIRIDGIGLAEALNHLAAAGLQASLSGLRVD